MPITIGKTAGLPARNGEVIVRFVNNDHSYGPGRVIKDNDSNDTNRAPGVITANIGANSIVQIKDSRGWGDGNVFWIIQPGGRFKKLTPFTLGPEHGWTTKSTVEILDSRGLKKYIYTDNQQKRNGAIFDFDISSNVKFSRLAPKGGAFEFRVLTPGQPTKRFWFDGHKIGPLSDKIRTTTAGTILNQMGQEIAQMEAELRGVEAGANKRFHAAVNSYMARRSRLITYVGGVAAANKSPTFRHFEGKSHQLRSQVLYGKVFTPEHAVLAANVTSAAQNINLAEGLADLATVRGDWSGNTSAEIVSGLKNDVEKTMAIIGRHLDAYDDLVRSVWHAVNGGLSPSQLGKALNVPNHGDLDKIQQYIHQKLAAPVAAIKQWLAFNAERINYAVGVYQAVRRKEKEIEDQQKAAERMALVGSIIGAIASMAAFAGAFGALGGLVMAYRVRKDKLIHSERKLAQYLGGRQRPLTRSEQNSVNNKETNIAQTRTLIRADELQIGGWTGSGVGMVLTAGVGFAELDQYRKFANYKDPQVDQKQVARMFEEVSASEFYITKSAEYRNLGYALGRFHSAVWQSTGPGKRLPERSLGGPWRLEGQPIPGPEETDSPPPIGSNARRRAMLRVTYDAMFNDYLNSEDARAKISNGTIFSFRGDHKTNRDGDIVPWLNMYETEEPTLKQFFNVGGVRG